MPPPPVGITRNLLAQGLQMARLAWKAALANAKAHVNPAPQLQYARVPVYPQHPLHPSAILRQSRRYLHTTVAAAAARGVNSTAATARLFSSTAALRGGGGGGTIAPRIAAAVRRTPGRAPFASQLRPNLTGGTLPRVAGGYGSGTARRYFSHTPQPAAQVLHHVSQSVRAALLTGREVQFEGGSKKPMRFGGIKKMKKRAVPQQMEKKKKTQQSLGAFVEFSLEPTITAVTPVAALSSPSTLLAHGLLEQLDADVACSSRHLALVMADVRALAALGDLPVSYDGSELKQRRLRVHFPNSDVAAVERLVNELGIRRGMVVQAEDSMDEDYENFAPSSSSSSSQSHVDRDLLLMFPLLTSSMSLPSLNMQQSSRVSRRDQSLGPSVDLLSSVHDDGSLVDLTEEDEYGGSTEEFNYLNEPTATGRSYSGFQHSPADYQEIHRFIELCHQVQSRC